VNKKCCRSPRRTTCRRLRFSSAEMKVTICGGLLLNLRYNFAGTRPWPQHLCFLRLLSRGKSQSSFRLVAGLWLCSKTATTWRWISLHYLRDLVPRFHPICWKVCIPKPQVVLETGHSAAERNYFVIYETEDEVRAAHPDLGKLEKLHPAGVCITAPGNRIEFVSRYFAPSYGIPEDPVTGSTHCTLGPYWSVRLNKNVLRARQVSARGGEVVVEPRGERVTLKGKAVLYLTGTITL
jgi:hypothetical protein